MNNSDLARFVEKNENLILFQQERLILDVTELMQQALTESGTRRIDLAKQLNVTRGRITQILSGDENLTLRTIADVFTALGKHLSTTLETLEVEHSDWYCVAGAISQTVTLQKAWEMVVGPDESGTLLAG